jgi:hypothetical protein
MEELKPTVHVAAPLLDYECNQRGCCCRGWRIPFRADDLVRLATHLPAEEHSDGIVDGLIIITDEDHRTIDHIRLEGVGEDDSCRFLEESGQCGVHIRHGTEALPDLCVEFPAFSFVMGNRFEFHHDAICPEVINALERSSADMAELAIDPPIPEAYGLRMSRGSKVLQPVPLNGVALDWPRLMEIRSAVMVALTDASRPALETLCAIAHALGRVAEGEGDEPFVVDQEAVDREAFGEFLYEAMDAYEAPILRTYFWRARRFMFDHEYGVHGLDLPESTWDALDEHLANWQEALLARVEPEEPALRRLMLRYMGHRYWSGLATSHSDLRISFGFVPLVTALSLRVAAAVASCVGGQADNRALKVGLTTGEYVYRNSRLPVEGFPWFVPEGAASSSA